MSSIRIVDPVTGVPLLAGANLENAYLLIASQIFTYEFEGVGQQDSELLDETFVLDAQNYALGISMLTKATQGQVHRIEVAGNSHSGRSLKTN